MKAYILHDKVHQVLDYTHPAYDFPPESWSPPPEALFAFDYMLTPYIIEQVTPYDSVRGRIDMTYVLQTVKDKKKPLFAAAFALLETHAARPTSSLTLRLAEGATTIPDDDFDAGLLWSIEQVKQANRDLLAELNAMTIPDGTTVEDAQAILAQALAVVPWLPESYGGDT